MATNNHSWALELWGALHKQLCDENNATTEGTTGHPWKHVESDPVSTRTHFLWRTVHSGAAGGYFVCGDTVSAGRLDANRPREDGPCIPNFPN